MADDEQNTYWTAEVWDRQLGELKAYLDMWHDFPLVSYAAIQGAHNFVPSMLPKLWHGHHCGYSTPIYREAYYRGFYSAAAWYLIDRLALIASLPVGLEGMIEWYKREHTVNDWRRVPGHNYFVELSNTED